MGRTLEAFEVEKCAEAAHEVNRVWNKLIGAHVDPPWKDLMEDYKRTARNSVVGITAHDFNAEQTHAAWVAEMKSAGWTVGPHKDIVKKEHPCLVAWADLPEEYRVKDELWVDTVKSFTRNMWRIPQ